ncbi:MAG: aspartate/glutamate racemase family protein [Pseudomonadota bacterium]|uniref:aspartate/glutamate racemase family protein n=1 Tax=Roseovarius TaxID=74030 RepID=UPI0022A88CF2|nr:amino acid racemase [Roseovarius sp. EGI FJ00037]MCZ0813244.1 amino acid racemase [Roseovarius sp. EGI FJ00037]
MRTVGILGGMGPEATILLMQKVLDAVPARDDGDHIPLIVHQNPQVPSRIKALIDGTGEDPAPVLARMADDLARAGAEALAMPCNTAHHYADALQGATSLPFLNMLDLTASTLAGAGAQKVGLLASPATRLTGVFVRPFNACGLEPVSLPEDSELLAIIRAVKAGDDPDKLAPRLTRQAERLADAGADHLLVACTELSFLTGALPDGVGWTDSLDCLVDGIVGFARG